jgi:hypothetical protein
MRLNRNMANLFVFEIEIEKSYNGNTSRLRVVAKNAKEAMESSIRHAKKSYWIDPEVVSIERKDKIDVFYK